MSKLVFFFGLLVLSGCATHANIVMPVVSQVHDSRYENKSLSYEIYYSQPKPGIFSNGEALPLAPLSQAELSVASSRVLKTFPTIIFKQLPSTVKRVDSGSGDFKLRIELVARHKKGPVYADYESAKNLAKSLVTLGLGSDEYNIVADFNATYTLSKSGIEVFSKEFYINEKVDHERAGFESYGSLTEYAGQLLEKHLILSMNDFFTDALGSL